MEGRDVAQPIVGATLQSPSTSILIYRYLEEHVDALLKTLHTFIISLNVVRYGSETVDELAQELLNELFTEALAHSERYDSSRQPGAWLYGVALNVTRRKKAERIRHYKEVSFSTLQTQSESDENFFERFASLMNDSPEQNVVAEQQAQFLLSQVSEDDQQILRLVVIHELDTTKIAQMLGIKAPAVRQRLHRAINRLRTILEAQGGESNV